MEAEGGDAAFALTARATLTLSPSQEIGRESVFVLAVSELIAAAREAAKSAEKLPNAFLGFAAELLDKP